MTDMQPGVSPIQSGSEQLRTPDSPLSGGPEHVPTLPAPEVKPETGIETGAERREQAAELQAAKADASAVAATVPVVPPADPALSAVPTQTTGVAGAPLTANDDDVIEKEWVDKAKQIITGTKDDPYKRGEQVSELQRDYLKKRYGKDVGAAA